MRLNPLLTLSIVFLYWLHLLRNFSIIYFLALGLLVFLFLITRVRCLDMMAVSNIGLIAAAGLFLYASLMAMAQQSILNKSALIGTFRIWSIFPLIYACSILSEISIRRIMIFFIFYYLIASASLAVQYAIGPISWFAVPGERAGMDRFASLTGSLTSFGSMLGVASLAAMSFLGRKKSYMFFGFLTIGAILSLQKSAFANIFLALFLWLWVLRIDIFKIKLFLMWGFILSIFFIIVVLGAERYGSNFGVLNKFLRFLLGLISGDEIMTADVGFFQSIFDRIKILPSLAINYYGWVSLLFGAGVFGAAGALGYPEIPMAHNGIVEIFLIFGFPLGLMLNLYLLYWLGVLLLRSRDVFDIEYRFVVSGLILFYFNNLFTGGGFFQPISAFIFWLLYFRSRYLIKFLK